MCWLLGQNVGGVLGGGLIYSFSVTISTVVLLDYIQQVHTKPEVYTNVVPLSRDMDQCRSYIREILNTCKHVL